MDRSTIFGSFRCRIRQLHHLLPAVQAWSELVLARVEPWLASRIGDLEFASYAADLERMEEEVASAASNYLVQQRDRLPSGLIVRTVVRRGTATVGLLNAIEQESIDLVVMSTHGRGGLRRFVLGSVADRLVRSGAPVLLVRADAAAIQPAAHDGSKADN